MFKFGFSNPEEDKNDSEILPGILIVFLLTIKKFLIINLNYRTS